ncbi:hypothetical protein OPT61_g6045 [Boeremia exigua]|uniref:Uncharacterized protein n=1 Tax=Boeremia exigua TaxID=749465 RepID=A0ACC2I881_9PLEO|nr:hypothetical protein OPT61_g6045 [Boeremia exigua]
MSDYDDSGSDSFPSSPRSPAHPVACPYFPGAVFTAYRHEAPAPFGGYYSDCPFPDQNELQQSSQLDWCISHRPNPGTTFLEETCSLAIKSEIRTGIDCGTQLVLLENGLVAKIFDPMFYSHNDKEFVDLKVDVTTAADSDYATEAAAYSELKMQPVQGDIMPAFYDSWTIKVTHYVGGEHITRDVRLILIEYISGEQMLDIEPENLQSKVREQIMIKVIEADYDLRYAGVCHQDLEPRNIMISLSPKHPMGFRLTLIDFGHSWVYRILFGGPPPNELRNPLFSWVGASLWSSYGWLPSSDEERDCGLWAIFGDGRDGKYVKVEKDPNCSLGRPLRHQHGSSL